MYVPYFSACGVVAGAQMHQHPGGCRPGQGSALPTPLHPFSVMWHFLGGLKPACLFCEFRSLAIKILVLDHSAVFLI